MTVGSFNNQSCDVAVSVVRLRYGFREGCFFTTCRVSELYLSQARERKFVVHPVLDQIFMADLEVFGGHAQFGQNVKFTNFYGV